MNSGREVVGKKAKSFAELMREAREIDQSEFGLFGTSKEADSKGSVKPVNKRDLQEIRSGKESQGGNSREASVERGAVNYRSEQREVSTRPAAASRFSGAAGFESTRSIARPAGKVLPGKAALPRFISTTRNTAKKSRNAVPDDLVRLNTVKRDLTTIEELQDRSMAKRAGLKDVGDKRRELELERERDRLMRQEQARREIVKSRGESQPVREEIRRDERPKKPASKPIKSRTSSSEYPPTEKRRKTTEKITDEILQDHEYVEKNYSSIIQGLFGYNRRQFADDDDSSDMEADYAMVRREEAKRYEINLFFYTDGQHAAGQTRG